MRTDANERFRLPRRSAWAAAAFVATTLLSAGLAFGQPSEFDRRVPIEICKVKYDTTNCIIEKNGTITVDYSVVAMGDKYKLCLRKEEREIIGKPARVMLLFDQSISMCDKEGNDFYDKRIEGAYKFAQGLKAFNENSEIGVIRYWYGVKQWVKYNQSGLNCPKMPWYWEPVRLNSNQNMSAIKNQLGTSSCYAFSKCAAGSNDTGSTSAWNAGGIPKIASPNTLQKTLATNPGDVLAFALMGKDYVIVDTMRINAQFIDKGYPACCVDSLQRHIIMFVDGEWEDKASMGPTQLISLYNKTYPNRPLPFIHTIWIQSDKTKQACAADPSLKFCTGLEEFRQLSAATKGIFFEGITPDAISGALDSLLGVITKVTAEKPSSILVTHLGRGDQMWANSQPIPSPDNKFYVSIPDISLDYGINKLEFMTIVEKADSTGLRIDTLLDTVTIIRKSDPNEIVPVTPGQLGVGCRIDTTSFSISTYPGVADVGNKITVDAQIYPTYNDYFFPDDIIVRGIAPFTADNNTIALLHLEGDLSNTSGAAATGSPNFTSPMDSLHGAFGASVSSGKFSLPLSSNLTRSFTLECWIRPI